jgi:hypothetical protein
MRIAPSKFVPRLGGSLAMAMRKIYNSVYIYQALPTIDMEYMNDYAK